MNNNDKGKDSSILKDILVKLDDVIKTTDNLKHYISETTKAVEGIEVNPEVNLDGKAIYDNTSNKFAMSKKRVR